MGAPQCSLKQQTQEATHFQMPVQVERLLEHGTCVNQQDDYGETALHMACMAGHIDVVRILVVEHQAKLDVQNWEGWAPIIWAVVHGHIAVVKFLKQRVRS